MVLCINYGWFLRIKKKIINSVCDCNLTSIIDTFSGSSNLDKTSSIDDEELSDMIIF